jgi:hypothetical protein
MTEKSVFISYSHRDIDPKWLRAFADALRDRHLNIWVDVWDLQPGDDWADTIERALLESDAIIAVISGAASDDPNVYFELGAAVGANKRLILVVDPSHTASIPFDLQRRQWIDLGAPEATAREVARAIGAPG